MKWKEASPSTSVSGGSGERPVAKDMGAGWELAFNCEGCWGVPRAELGRPGSGSVAMWRRVWLLSW